MLSAAQYAEKHGYKAATVKQWCKEGNLPGVQKVPTGRKKGIEWMYMIPEDAEPIRPKRPYQKLGMTEKEASTGQNPQLIQPLKTLQTRHDKCEHVRKYCTSRSFRRLSAETGMTHEEIRRVYDRLHEVYGI